MPMNVSNNFLPTNPRFGEGCPSSLAVWCQLNGHAKLGSFPGLHPGAPLRRGPGGDRGKVGWGMGRGFLVKFDVRTIQDTIGN